MVTCFKYSTLRTAISQRFAMPVIPYSAQGVLGSPKAFVSPSSEPVNMLHYIMWQKRIKVGGGIKIANHYELNCVPLKIHILKY